MAKGKGKPTIAERAKERICPNCGAPSPDRISARGPAPLYCRPTEGRDCKREMNNRNLTDGAGIIQYIKAWRADRGTGEIAQKAFQHICRIADALNEADRLAGRPRADYAAAVMMNSNAAPVDERRYGLRKLAEGRARAAREAETVSI